MKRKAVFFDRDNTLIVSDGYLGDPSQVKLVEGAADAVARLRSLGFLTIVFSNQSGVARGMFDEQAVQAVNAKMDELLRAANPDAIIDRHEYCPFHPEATVERYRQDSELRKPRPGMIYRAHHALDLDLQKSWVIGDAPRDIEAGRTAGCKTILFQDPSLSKSPAAAELKPTIRPDFICTTLKEAVDSIETSIRQFPRIAPPEEIPPTKFTKPEPPAPPAPTPIPESPPINQPFDRIESIANQILQELKRRNEREHTDFSVSKLMAGIVQVIVLGCLFVCYLNYHDNTVLLPLLVLSCTFQMLVVALLLMAKR